jgi:CheY-like chemotaxis protein
VATIVVVDDDLWIRAMLRHVLEREGHEVLDAENGIEGTLLCRKHVPDLVITDVHMPGQDGFETIVCLRREFPDLRIIAISGGHQFETDFNLKLTGGLGAERTLSKPIKKETLLSTVRELLNPCC